MKTPIEQEFNCFGYFGFGSGAALSRTMTNLQNVGFTKPFSKKEMYCNTCPLVAKCWDKHKERVKSHVRELAEHIDRIGGKPEYFEYIKGGGVDPYLSVMMGNTEDGGWVIAVGKPKQRQEMTLPYPFK